MIIDKFGMSYRDLRNFCEMLRGLGYPRLVSLENFRSPNFPLVAEILTWLVFRYDPSADIPREIDAEADRVIFIRSAAQFLASKAHVKVNTKRLYQADGYAVKELLKVAAILYDAMKTSPDTIVRTAEDGVSVDVNINEKVGDLKRSRQLASEITLKGASLYDLLAKEVQLREVRNSVVSRPLEIREVEVGLKESLAEAEKEIQRMQQATENITIELQNYDQKIDKKRQELERLEKRLHTLKKVRPAFMDEFEKLEAELKGKYEEYIYKFRCLIYLEQQLQEYESNEQEKAKERQAVTIQLLERMKEEEGLRLDNLGVLGATSGDEGTSGDHGLKRRQQRPGAGGSRRVFGSMTAGEDDSLDTDSELLLDGAAGGVDLGSDLGSDSDLELDETPAAAVRKAAANPQPKEESDDDF